MNWGVRITIFLILFISFIMYLVISLSLTKVDLQAEDYYQQELKYEDRISAINNYKDDNQKINISTLDSLVIIDFSPLPSNVQLIGNIYFFRPNNDKLDFTYPLQNESVSSGVYPFPKSQFTKGKYNVKIDYSLNGKDYFIEKGIFI